MKKYIIFGIFLLIRFKSVRRFLLPRLSCTTIYNLQSICWIGCQYYDTWSISYKKILVGLMSRELERRFYIKNDNTKFHPFTRKCLDETNKKIDNLETTLGWFI